MDPDFLDPDPDAGKKFRSGSEQKDADPEHFVVKFKFKSAKFETQI